jgi:hypothetical protein
VDDSVPNRVLVEATLSAQNKRFVSCKGTFDGGKAGIQLPAWYKRW